MNSVPQVVTHEVVLEVAGPDGSTPVEAELRYDSKDPYAVTVAFRQPGAEVVWVFGRDLLMRGLSEAAGHGDVQVFPSLDEDGRAEVGIFLRSPSGQALAKAPLGDVLDFLARSTRVVWPGTESSYVSADEAIAEILVGR
jgi:Streptomyces sporulation and cell division protein, SsgA